MKTRKARKFPYNGPTFEMQARYFNGKISAEKLIKHCVDRFNKPGR